MTINIGVEPTEIMASVAMLMKPSDLKAYSKNHQGLINFIKEGKKLAAGSKVVYSSGTKDKFLKAFNSSERDFLKAAAVGISAANSIREWVPVRSKESGKPISATAIPTKVFLTGDSWPAEVKDFQVKAYGFQSYNSSDIIIQWKNPKGLSFYGVSLKQKPSVTSNDPTLINKAFDSVLQSDSPKELKELNKIKDQVIQARTDYFAKVVRQAVKAGYIKFKGGSLPSDNDELMKITIDAEFAEKPMKLINIKGKGTIDLSKPKRQSNQSLFKILDKSTKKWREFLRGEMLDKKISMRAFVNAKIASDDSVFNAMIPVMNKYSNEFAKSLLNLVLKQNLYEELDENTFAFALVTGAGDIDKEGNPKIGHIPAKGLYTVLCGLSALNKSNTKYKMVLDTARNDKADAAKVFINLMKGTLNILNLQLKYKGNFTIQPQFAATIAPSFKEVLQEQWGKRCKVY